MKRLFVLFLSFCLLAGLLTACAAPPTLVPTAEPTATPAPATPTVTPADALSKLHWFGTSAFLYNGSQKIYFDPVTLAGKIPPADIILITHAHNDHWSVNDLKQIIGPNTALVISPSVSVAYEAAKDELGISAIVLAEGESAEVHGVSIEAVAAFDTDSHRRENGGAGYIITVDGVRLYHAGATNSYPEMVQNDCDIAILPLYNTNDLITMVKRIPAKVFVIEHTSYYAAQAAATLAKGDLTEEQMIASLAPGPFEP